MATFLELVNQVRQECDMYSSGALTTLSGVTGENMRVKNWVIRAWNEIQEMRNDWKWMRTAYSFTTTANDGSYTSVEAGIATRFGRWDKLRCTVYLTASGVSDEQELEWMDYETFLGHYLTGQQSDSRPLHFTVGNSNELLLGPKPESTLYTVTGFYYKSPQVLSDAADIPELPEHHDAIAWLAMRKFGRFYTAPEVYSEAQSEGRRLIRLLMNKYLPEFQDGEALL